MGSRGTSAAEPPGGFVLDPYAARACAVKTQHRFDPRRADPGAPESLQDSFHGGLDHAASVADQLLAQVPGAVDLRGARGPDAAQRCSAAMDAGAPVILGGELPPDWDQHRAGRVDVLVRAGVAAGRVRYHPVLVKPRRMIERRVSGETNTWEVPVSPLEDIGAATAAGARTPGAVLTPDAAVRRREKDLIQLAHVYRLLEADGRTPTAAGTAGAAGTAVGGVIGTDEVLVNGTARRPVVTWIDLDAPILLTFSRSEPTGAKHRSALERLDHEHAFRVRIAENARAGGPPLVEPIRIDECAWCPWWSVCEPVMGPQDLSARIDTAPLDVREIRALRGLGIRTIDDLAGADLARLLPRYLPEVTHRDRAEQRLRNAARRSRMMRDGVELERTTTGPIRVRRAAVEIDFDLETYDERAYLWGFLIHDRRHPGPASYRAFTSWEPLDDVGEAALAREALTWLRALTQEAETCVYHYSSYETAHLARLAGARPEWAWLGPWIGAHFVDMYPPMRDNFFGSHGLGLKVAARSGAGFRWRDAEPSGLNSLGWYEDAVGSSDPLTRAAARRRLLEYNEDDVRATWELRSWLGRAYGH